MLDTNTNTPDPITETETTEDYSNLDVGELPILKEGESYKGLVPLSELSKIHKDIPKHIKNLQGAKTKAEQRTAALEKELASLKGQVQSETSKAVSLVTSLKPLAAIDKRNYDLHTEEGFEAYQAAVIEYRVQDTLNKMYSPVQEKLVAEKKQETDAYIESFLDSKPEFADDDFLDSVVTKMESHNLSIDDAYTLVKSSYKGPPITLAATISKSNDSAQKRTDLLSIGSTGKHNKTSFVPEGNSAWEIYNSYKKAGRLEDLVRDVDR